MLIADDGYYFGIGAFETIAVEAGKAMFLQQHYARLQRAMDFLKIEMPIEEISAQVDRVLQTPEIWEGRKVLKITVSPKNVLVTTRENTYRREDYERGFTADISSVRRNETSPFTYHKTLNYGDCLWEKRLAKSRGIDEPIFLNTRGEIAEGACTNVFFVRQGRIFTPPVSAGILSGILRKYLCDTQKVEEKTMTVAEALECEEMFFTNSLMGVMPAVSLAGHLFASQKIGRELAWQYWNIFS